MWKIILKKAIWLIKQLFPCTYCDCRDNGNGSKTVRVYKMWMGREYGAKEWEVTGERGGLDG